MEFNSFGYHVDGPDDCCLRPACRFTDCFQPMKFIWSFIFAALFYASGASAQFSSGCGAGFCANIGSGGVAPVTPFFESERSVWNLDTGSVSGPDFIYDYAFINHVQTGNF